MSRIRTDLKPAVKGLKSSSVSSTSLIKKSENGTKLPPVSPRCMSASPRGSVDLKWTLDMVRGYTLHGSEKRRIAGKLGTKTCDCLQTNRDYEKLNQKYMALQKSVCQLQEEIKGRSKTIFDLQEKLNEKRHSQEEVLLRICKALSPSVHHEEDKYNQCLQQYKQTVSEHESKVSNFYEQIKGLKDVIMERTKETDELKFELAETTEKYDEQIKDISKENQVQLLALCQSHKEELASRDSKISMLKMQLESALNNNSKERQRQLDELTKELTRVTDETELLKTKLRALTKQRHPEQCRNCTALEETLQTKLIELRSKDESIAELLQHGQKMAKQLSRQDEFLKLCERASGNFQRR